MSNGRRDEQQPEEKSAAAQARPVEVEHPGTEPAGSAIPTAGRRHDSRSRRRSGAVHRAGRRSGSTWYGPRPPGIQAVLGIHLTGVRDVAAATDQTLVPGRGSPGCLKSPTPANGYATRTSSAPESPASTPPVLVRQPRASRVVHRPPAANNHMGNSAYMDTPDKPLFPR